MFRVSLLPDNYRRRLENKIKIDFFARVSLIIFICLFVIVCGVIIKGRILDSKLENVKVKNSQLEAKFPALQESRQIYNDLNSSKKMIESILPKDPEAVEFFTIVSNKTPDYVEITEMNLENWFTAGICTLSCKVQDYKDVQDYKAIFETDEMKQLIKLVQVTSIKRNVDTDGSKNVTFTIALSMSNAVAVPTEAPKINSASTTASEKETKKSNSKETTTAASTTAKTTASGDKGTTVTTKKGD